MNRIDIKTLTGIVIFSHECEDNSIKKTIEEAVKNNVSLADANLRCADLRGANLRCANLRYADLSGADISGSDLRGADLSGSILISTDLRGANLRCANLNGADLNSTNLSGADLRYAYLSGSDLSCSKGLLYAQCSFSSHGECGRQLLGIKLNNEIIFHCGCFHGNEDKLREYIENGKEEYKKSRLKALEFILETINL